jgi:hypothetical protein
MLVFFYVDDIALIGRDLCVLQHLKDALMAHYEIRDLGSLEWFLGIRVLRDRPARKLWLSQDSYIDKLLTSFNIVDPRPVHTPMSTDELTLHTGQASAQDIHAYQRKMGSILYAATITRPDIARTTCKLMEFLQNPSPRHHEAADRVLRYLHTYRYYAIEFSSSVEPEHVFECSSDAAYADNVPDRKSSEGYLLKVYGGPVDWRATKQKTVTTSSTEAELLALSHAAKEVIAWQRLFCAIGFDPGHPVSICCDNQQTI